MKQTKITKISKITKRFRAGDLVPFKSDLNFDFFKRDSGSLTLQDKIAGNDAAVLGGVVGVFDGSSNYNTGLNLIGNDFSILVYLESSTVKSLNVPLSQYASGEIGRLALFYNDSSSGRLGMRIGSDLIEYNVANPDGFNIVIYKRIGNIGEIILNGTSVVTGAMDEPTYQGENTIIGGLPSGFVGKCAGVKIFNSDKSYSEALNDDPDYYYGMNGHGIESNTGLESVNNGVNSVSLSDYTPQSTQDALDLGYYENDTTGEQVINKALNTTGLSDTTGWTAHEGNKLHNFINSYVEYPNEPAIFQIFDRSNTTIYNQSARDSVYYDSSNPYLFHISELNYDTWNSYLNTAYQDRNFTGIKTNYGDQLEIFDILSYATQKTGDDLIDVLNYIKYNYLADGYEYLLDSNGEKIYDSEGKVITTPIS